MRNTGTSRRGMLAAALTSLLVNASALWLLLPPSPPASRQPAAAEVLLVVDFVARQPSPRDVPPAPMVTPRTRAPAPAVVAVARAIPPPHPEPAGSVAPPPEPGAAAMSAAFLQRAREQPDRAPEIRGQPPFARRPPALPGRDARTFRMREPPSPARVVARIGMLFGGDGVTGCTDIEARIAAHATTGEHVALQSALEYERRLCRP